MANKTIFTVGLELPCEDDSFKYVSISSNNSLTDADIILFKPNMIYTLSSKIEDIRINGNIVERWQNELNMALKNGKNIIFFLNSYNTYPYKLIHNVAHYIGNYEILPINFKKIENVKGERISLTNHSAFLKKYWNLVEKYCTYEAYIEIDNALPLMQTKSGEKTLGYLYKKENEGSIILLPNINLPKDFKYNIRDGISEEGVRFGKALLKEIVNIDKYLKSNTDETPPPEWVLKDDYKLKNEIKLSEDIKNKKAQIEALKEQIIANESQLEKETLPKKLLYEQGKPLENAIMDALHTIGFEAQNYDDGISEYDFVFSSEDERFIGEAEGKDSKPINMAKFRQLETNINEDFERDEIEKHAKGVLFGNSCRFLEPKDRKEFFTDKALISAKRTGIALVNTQDLFDIVKYLKSNNDKEYTKQVRDCFKNTSGEIVKFPPIPENQAE